MITTNTSIKELAIIELKNKLKKRYGIDDIEKITNMFHEFKEKHRSNKKIGSIDCPLLVLIGAGGAGTFTLSSILYMLNVSVRNYIIVDPDILTADNVPRLIYPPTEDSIRISTSSTIYKNIVAKHLILSYSYYWPSGVTIVKHLTEEDLKILLDYATPIEDAIIIEAASYETLRHVSKYIMDKGPENIKAKVISVGYSTEEQKFHIFDVVKEPEIDHKPVVNDYSGPIDLLKWWNGAYDIAEFFANLEFSGNFPIFDLYIDDLREYIPEKKEFKVELEGLDIDVNILTEDDISIAKKRYEYICKTILTRLENSTKEREAWT